MWYVENVLLSQLKMNKSVAPKSAQHYHTSGLGLDEYSYFMTSLLLIYYYYFFIACKFDGPHLKS